LNSHCISENIDQYWRAKYMTLFQIRLFSETYWLSIEIYREQADTIK